MKSSYFFKSYITRLVATASALITGLASLKLFKHYLVPESYGAMLMALQVVNYLGLLDGGFRTYINRELLASTDEAERSRILSHSQRFYSLFTFVLIVIEPLAMI